MQFDDIFREYYALFRGQATNIPAYGSAEYSVGIQLANNAIRKWVRADGEEWVELWTTHQLQTPGAAIATNTHTYNILNMRKVPKKVYFSDGSSYDVIDPGQIDDYSDLNGLAYFTGGANKGWVLHLDGNLAPLNGKLFDFPYLSNPVFIPNTASAPATVPQMSDVNFMIQDMLASRYANAKNGFGYKTAKNDATVALQNMKIENGSGTQGKSLNLFQNQQTAGWGVSGTPVNDIKL